MGRKGWTDKETKVGEAKGCSSLSRLGSAAPHKYHLMFPGDRLCHWFASDSESALPCLQGQSCTKHHNPMSKIHPRFPRHLMELFIKAQHPDVETLLLTSCQVNTCM